MTRVKTRKPAKRREGTARSRRVDLLAKNLEEEMKNLSLLRDSTSQDAPGAVEPEDEEPQPGPSTPRLARPVDPRPTTAFERLFHINVGSPSLVKAIDKCRKSLEIYKKACSHHAKPGRSIADEILDENPPCSCLAMRTILESTSKLYNLPYDAAYLPETLEKARVDLRAQRLERRQAKK